MSRTHEICGFPLFLALGLTAGSCASEKTPPETKGALSIKPYAWEGPYAEMRDDHGATHDSGLCAELRAPWMAKDERIIVRSSEIVGHETGFFYDDHFPPSEPEGRGKDYQHIPFQWNDPEDSRELSANCQVPGKGAFSLTLSAEEDFLDIELTLRHDLVPKTGETDWCFCVVARESPSFSDEERTRTYLYDGEKLSTFSELLRTPERIELFQVSHGNDFISQGHAMFPVNPVKAKASVTIVESPDGKHVAALGFERSYEIFGDAKGNKCFHADPYLGPFTQAGEERTMRGRLYVMAGTAADAFERFKRDFPGAF